jgi:hypothetical protein
MTAKLRHPNKCKMKSVGAISMNKILLKIRFKPSYECNKYVPASINNILLKNKPKLLDKYIK